jgi:4-hydroxybutyrate dehydrogenase
MALITYVTRVQFDFGALALLAEELALAGIRRPLVVTDRGVVAAGLWERVRAALPADLPVALFADTRPTRPRPPCATPRRRIGRTAPTG